MRKTAIVAAALKAAGVVEGIEPCNFSAAVDELTACMHNMRRGSAHNTLLTPREIEDRDKLLRLCRIIGADFNEETFARPITAEETL